MTTDVLIVPGLHNSGPLHWQSWLLDRLPEARRIEQADWDRPDLDLWAQRLRRAVQQTDGQVVLVAHSFGCLAAIEVARAVPERVKSALLVAPADPEKFLLDRSLVSERLPVRAVVVGSENDPWMAAEQVRDMAAGLQADFVNLGLAGHINVQSGYGPWPGVLPLVARLRWPRVSVASRQGEWAGLGASGC
jgi:predicted alpha/beta hydrolase family esterase